jgi:hypothetical protein
MVEIKKKDFLFLMMAWFIISFVIMWFLGGACMSLFVAPADVSSACVASSSLDGLRAVPVIGWFIPYTEWVSLFYWFAPIAGFVFAYIALNWWNKYFETKEATSILFLPLIIIILLGGFYLNLAWYYGEAAAQNSNDNVDVALYVCFENDSAFCNETVTKLNNEYLAQAQSNNSKPTQFLMVNYWSELRQSILLTFVFGAIAAWIPLFAKQYIEKKKD